MSGPALSRSSWGPSVLAALCGLDTAVARPGSLNSVGFHEEAGRRRADLRDTQEVGWGGLGIRDTGVPSPIQSGRVPSMTQGS